MSIKRVIAMRTTNRPGFTLVEILVAFVILSIVSAMVASALSGALASAREERARGYINRLNLLVQRIYEEESRRRLTITFDPCSAVDRNLTQLMWKRDWLRCAMPDRISDVATNSVSQLQQAIAIPANPFVSVILINDGGGIRGLRAQRLKRYRDRIQRTYAALGAAPGAWTTLWTPEHQGAECLHLILSSNTVDGVPAIESLQARDVGDTDGDGMPEVLDPWGKPVAFMRWPVGFYVVPNWNTEPNTVEVQRIIGDLGRDPLDTLYSDPRYNPTNTEDDPFWLLPLVISAGSDGEFDIQGIDPDPVTGVPAVYDYVNQTRPPASTTSNPSLSYNSPFSFVDPYLTLYGSGRLDRLGAPRDLVETGFDNSSDNIVPDIDLGR